MASYEVTQPSWRTRSGIQKHQKTLDSGLRRNGGKGCSMTFLKSSFRHHFFLDNGTVCGTIPLSQSILVHRGQTIRFVSGKPYVAPGRERGEAAVPVFFPDGRLFRCCTVKGNTCRPQVRPDGSANNGAPSTRNRKRTRMVWRMIPFTMT